MKIEKVADILRMKDTRIITVRMGETVATAAMLMEREDIGALVVKDVCRTEGNVVVGVFTERDVARAVAIHGPAALNKTVSALLTRPLVSCRASDTIEKVAGLMVEHQVRLLPVLDEHTLIGVISVSDIVGPLSAREADPEHRAASDLRF